MPSSSAPRRSDVRSNASASQRLGSYVCHDPIVPIRRTRPAPASIYELLDDARRRRRPWLLLGDRAGSAFVKNGGANRSQCEPLHAAPRRADVASRRAIIVTRVFTVGRHRRSRLRAQPGVERRRRHAHRLGVGRDSSVGCALDPLGVSGQPQPSLVGQGARPRVRQPSLGRVANCPQRSMGDISTL